MNMSMTYLFSQLLNQAPMLLVYVGGMAFCAVYWRRASLAAMLAVIGLALMLFTTLAGAVVTNYIIQNRNATGASMSSMLMVSGLAFSVVRAVGLALVVAGVFVHRREGEDRGFNVEMMPEAGRTNY